MSGDAPSPPSDWIDFQPTLEAARQGDADARQALFECFYPRVERMVHHSLATDMRAKRPWIGAVLSTGDVVQEVFLSVLGNLGSVECQTEEAFAGYLARIVRNRLIDSIRFHQAARRDGRRSVNMPETGGPSSRQSGPVTRVSSAESMEQYESALAEFPDRERILLRERLERSERFQDLADQLAYPTADAARKAFYVAQARLLLKLQARGTDYLPPTR